MISGSFKHEENTQIYVDLQDLKSTKNAPRVHIVIMILSEGRGSGWERACSEEESRGTAGQGWGDGHDHDGDGDGGDEVMVIIMMVMVM